MVNNSTNINKTNNHLTPQLTEHKKESLNSDGQQFHKYQPDEQSSHTANHWVQKKPQHNDDGFPGPGLGHAHKCDRVKPVIW